MKYRLVFMPNHRPLNLDGRRVWAMLQISDDGPATFVGFYGERSVLDSLRRRRQAGR